MILDFGHCLRRVGDGPGLVIIRSYMLVHPDSLFKIL